jgi:hypothetical protein
MKVINFVRIQNNKIGRFQLFVIFVIFIEFNHE